MDLLQITWVNWIGRQDFLGLSLDRKGEETWFRTNSKILLLVVQLEEILQPNELGTNSRLGHQVKRRLLRPERSRGGWGGLPGSERTAPALLRVPFLGWC